VIRADALTRCELVDGAAPQRRADLIAEPPLAARVPPSRLGLGDLVEEVDQKPAPSGGGSGLFGSPSLAGPSLYYEGATSFGPSA
jgi:hypothetical protein